jgi:5'-deoxynucleotidase YfbR-like HD superfamily hydrolase
METLETNNYKSLLKLEAVAPHVYELLDRVDRTGWVNRNVENPENVREHTEALLKLADELSEYLTPEETDGLMDMLEVHDWPEAIHGDEVILELDPVKRKALKEVKFNNEVRALEELCKDLPNRQEIIELSDDPAAVFARQLDKYQAVEKAWEYEQAQGILLFQEFLTYAINFVHHPVLLERLERLKTNQVNK